MGWGFLPFFTILGLFLFIPLYLFFCCCVLVSRWKGGEVLSLRTARKKERKTHNKKQQLRWRCPRMVKHLARFYASQRKWEKEGERERERVCFSTSWRNSFSATGASMCVYVQRSGRKSLWDFFFLFCCRCFCPHPYQILSRKINKNWIYFYYLFFDLP